MVHPLPAGTIGRTVVVLCYLVALALVGRPVWLAAVLGLLLVAVWAVPLAIARGRRPVTGAGPGVQPREAGPF